MACIICCRLTLNCPLLSQVRKLFAEVQFTCIVPCVGPQWLLWALMKNWFNESLYYVYFTVKSQLGSNNFFSYGGFFPPKVAPVSSFTGAFWGITGAMHFFPRCQSPWVDCRIWQYRNFVILTTSFLPTFLRFSDSLAMKKTKAPFSKNRGKKYNKIINFENCSFAPYSSADSVLCS